MSDEKFIVPSSSPVVPGKFDTRVLNKSLKNGTLTPEEVKAHMKQLPDESEWARFVNYDEVVGNDSIESSDDSDNQKLGVKTSHVPSEGLSDGGYGWGGSAPRSSSSSSGTLYGDGGIAKPHSTTPSGYNLNEADEDELEGSDEDDDGGITH